MELQIIRASEFIRAGAQGRPDPRASKAALAELAGACRRRGIDRALLDLRELQFEPAPVFKPTELAALVDTFHELGFSREQRLAVLYAADPHHGARLFAFISAQHGWNVKAFSNFEAALGWLALTEEALGDAEPESA
ncbi:MAG TPA: hypothetical protein VNZ22_21890 [Bacillota bacterium]|nr:hypothetical protein [Bacillota bacterium]